MRRLRRLVPAYLTCALGVTLVLWPLCSGLPLTYTLRPDHWIPTWVSLLAQGAQWNLPQTFTDHTYRSANGSVWTLPYEILLYGLMGLLWFGGLRQSRKPWTLPLLLWAGASILALWNPSWLPTGDVRFAGFRILHLLHFLGYFTGGWLLAQWSPSTRSLSIGIGLLMLLRLFLSHPEAIAGLDLLLFPSLVHWIGRFEPMHGRSLPDWSYGFYLWGWPVQQTWIHFLPGLSAWELTLLATFTVLPLAAASSRWIEQPFLPRSRNPQSSVATEPRP